MVACVIGDFFLCVNWSLLNWSLLSVCGPVKPADLWPLFPGLGWPFHPGPNIAAEDERGAAAIGFYERFEFYRKASEAYLIIVTGEKALYANVMVQKGVI